MRSLKFSLLRASCLTLLVIATSCAPFMNAPGVSTTRPACAPRPTRPPETVATFTRDPHPKSPTPAPRIPTRGSPPPTIAPKPYPTLARPLDTKERVLEFLLESEIRNYVKWDEPWCLETLQIDPTRIDVQHFNSVEEAESTMGGWGPNQPQEPAWVVTIQGTTYVSGPGFSGSVAYIREIIGERTGRFYMSGGGRNLPPPTLSPPETHAPRTRKPRTPRAKLTITPIIQTRTP